MARIAPAGGTAQSTEVKIAMWASNCTAKFQIFVGSAVPEQRWLATTSQSVTTESHSFANGWLPLRS
jgi:hypothetical protein